MEPHLAVPYLQAAWLDNTRVTDAGMAHLRRAWISWLYLRNTQVTDAGLAQLDQPHSDMSPLYPNDLIVALNPLTVYSATFIYHLSAPDLRRDRARTCEDSPDWELPQR